ncbi:hypothetical protein XELAEV_18026572mg [Xenopus laevis]|uniref:Uncharacterized protein n=1 Tax=Xenopus laevis TaxID=8355 RepID=A0A974CUM8_XENLA|nr:hypothetical protein XELAEV_18026572mg [Xenopus laevis]
MGASTGTTSPGLGTRAETLPGMETRTGVEEASVTGGGPGAQEAPITGIGPGAQEAPITGGGLGAQAHITGGGPGAQEAPITGGGPGANRSSGPEARAQRSYIVYLMVNMGIENQAH